MTNEQKLTERIAALLAKAERTDNPHEAEAFISKAQALMTQHSIDMALVQGVLSSADQDKIETREVQIIAPYQKPKMFLLSGIADSNGCRVVVRGKEVAYVTGFTADIDMVLSMFNSLCIHATREMMGTEQPDTENTKTFRHSFWMGYAGKVGERLKAAKREVINDSEPGVGLVLVKKDKQVDAALKEKYPRLGRSNVSGGRGSGASAGSAAGDRAGLGRSVGAGGQRALGS